MRFGSLAGPAEVVSNALTGGAAARTDSAGQTWPLDRRSSWRLKS